MNYHSKENERLQSWIESMPSFSDTKLEFNGFDIHFLGFPEHDGKCAIRIMLGKKFPDKPERFIETEFIMDNNIVSICSEGEIPIWGVCTTKETFIDNKERAICFDLDDYIIKQAAMRPVEWEKPMPAFWDPQYGGNHALMVTKSKLFSEYIFDSHGLSLFVSDIIEKVKQFSINRDIKIFEV